MIELEPRPPPPIPPIKAAVSSPHAGIDLMADGRERVPRYDHLRRTCLRALRAVLGVVFPGVLDRPGRVPVGIGRAIIQIVREHAVAVADDHLVSQHDRMKGQKPLLQAGDAVHGDPPPRGLKAAWRLDQTFSSSMRHCVDPDIDRARARPVIGERTGKRRPPAVGLRRRGQMIRRQSFSQDLA